MLLAQFEAQKPYKKQKHCRWTPEDDNKLRGLVGKSVNPNWNSISLYFPQRTARQCEERWSYYLSPNVNNGAWSAEEDQILLRKYQEHGPQWKFLCNFFKGRTNSNIKNRYLYLKKKGRTNIVQTPTNQNPIINNTNNNNLEVQTKVEEVQNYPKEEKKVEEVKEENTNDDSSIFYPNGSAETFRKLLFQEPDICESDFMF